MATRLYVNTEDPKTLCLLLNISEESYSLWKDIDVALNGNASETETWEEYQDRMDKKLSAFDAAGYDVRSLNNFQTFGFGRLSFDVTVYGHEQCCGSTTDLKEMKAVLYNQYVECDEALDSRTEILLGRALAYLDLLEGLHWS